MEAIPSAAGWDEMSGGYPKRFAEYNSTTSTGSTVDLKDRKKVYDAYDSKNGDNYVNRRNETAETGTEKTDRRNVKNRVFTKKSVNVYVIFYPQYTYILIFFIYFCNKKTKT